VRIKEMGQQVSVSPDHPRHPQKQQDRAQAERSDWSKKSIAGLMAVLCFMFNGIQDVLSRRDTAVLQYNSLPLSCAALCSLHALMLLHAVHLPTYSQYCSSLYATRSPFR